MKFLQGYTTNDVRRLAGAGAGAGAAGAASPAQYTCFPTTKGRALAEGILAVPLPGTAPAPAVVVGGAGASTPAATSAAAGGGGSGGQALLLEVDAARKDALLKHLRLYKLRARVQIEDVSSTHAVHALRRYVKFSLGF